MNHPSPSLDARPVPDAPATFYLKHRWLMLAWGVAFIPFMLFLMSLRLHPIQFLNIFAHVVLILQALTWRVTIAPDGVRLYELWSRRRYAWADLSHIEVIERYGRRIVCLIHRQHVPDVSAWGRWWLPARLRRRCTPLAGHWANFAQIERLVLAHAPQLAGAPAGAWLVPAAPAERPRRFWLVLGYGSALALAVMVAGIILF